MQRIKKGVGTGDRWDMVRLENGIIGYISQNYVEEIPDVEIEKIEVSLKDCINNIIYKGETKTLDVKIYPEEAKEQRIEFISENPEIITVDDKGNVTGIRSGKTKIRVKSKENNVETSIDLECYSKVTNIVVDSEEEIYMQVGDYFKINAYVEPEDANEKGIVFEINNIEDNENIITIDEQGNIEAKKEGKVKVTVKAKENEEIKKEINVTVVRKMEDWEKRAFVCHAVTHKNSKTAVGETGRRRGRPYPLLRRQLRAKTGGGNPTDAAYRLLSSSS